MVKKWMGNVVSICDNLEKGGLKVIFVFVV